MTAAPTAISKDLIVNTYNPNAIDIQEFKAAILVQMFLIVGHSEYHSSLCE